MSLHSEMHEQPDVLAGLLDAVIGPTSEAAALLRRKDIVHAVIAARGTSDNAARYAK
jgi:glucosamine--fructose-6-phosphate aminotransferase (isomerizing)